MCHQTVEVTAQRGNRIATALAMLITGIAIGTPKAQTLTIVVWGAGERAASLAQSAGSSNGW